MLCKGCKGFYVGTGSDGESVVLTGQDLIFNPSRHLRDCLNELKLFPMFWHGLYGGGEKQGATV